jgi:hypothetical protein
MADIIIKFRGKEYIIPEDRAFPLGERIEDIALLGEVIAWSKRPHYHRMSRCLGEMLRFAGAEITDREVYGEVMTSLLGGGADGFVTDALFGLVTVLMDGAPQSTGSSGGKPHAS